MNESKKKNVLLVSPVFYGYELEIKKALESCGFQVTYYFFIRYNNNFLYLRKREKQFLRNAVNELKYLAQSKTFDYLFAVNSFFINNEIVDIARKNNKSIKTIIYLWDTIKNRYFHGIENYICNFDYRYSFDHKDCLEYTKLNLKHRPNFYHPIIDTLDRIQNPKYDISSVMSAQPERIRYINELDKKYPGLKKAVHIKLHRLKSFPAYLINHNVFIRPKHFKIRRLSIKQSIELFNNSKSVLDIPAANQNGLPFRSIDSIGLKKKLIIMNSNVINYDFYHPNNVYIIECGKSDSLLDFLSRPYKPIDESIRLKYSIDFWVKTIFRNENITYLNNA